MALITDWKMRCLICMKDVPAEIPVFGSQGQRKNLRRMMSEYLNLTAREHENEPKNICERCYDTLQKINDLKGCAQENKHNILLLRTLQRQDSEERRAEVIRLWLGSQRMQQSDMSVLREHYSSGQQQQPQPQQQQQQQQPQPPPQQQQQQPQPQQQQQQPQPQQQQQQPQPQQQQQQQQQPQPPQQQQQQQPQLPQQQQQQQQPQQQQPQSDFTCSSSRMSTNEERGSIALDISAAVSENSDALNHTQSVSSTAARQGTSQRVLHHRGRKRQGTPLPFSTPSSRSCSPQPGALPPESSRKPYRSAARSLKARSKIAEQRNGEHSGSPQPGSLPPESAGKSSASRKRSATLQAKGNNAVSQKSALMTKPQEKVEFHRAQSCSPVRGNSVSTSGEKRRRGRPRSKSLPPSKRRKLFDQAEPDYNETASKPTHWKPYLDDDICCGKITSSCDLKEFKKHIPFVKLQRVDVSTTTTTATTATTKKKIPWFQFPASQRSRKCEFTLVEDVLQGGIVQQFCWICNKTFPSIENMEQHLDEHVPKNRPGSSSSQDVTKPSSTATTPSFFACNLCQTQFSSNGFLQRHMMNHSQKKWSHKCTVCEETFQTSAILKRHMGNHNISEQVSTSTEDPTCHQEEQQEQVYACSCCLQEFTSEQALGKHMVQHRRCTLCNKTFTGKDELATHVGECHKVCSICDETVADEEELQAHIDTSHEKCNLCGEQFLFEEELSAHLKKHPYPCVMCLSAFNDKAQRIEHMKLSHQDMIELLKETMAKEKITV